METVGTMDRFLHAERFRKGKVQLRPAPIQLGSFLTELAAHFAYQARDKRLELQADAPDDCVVTSDRELLTLVAQNLLSNAIKYTQRGKVEVIGKPVKDGGCLITFKDEGPGIEAARLDELFAPFTRGETHGQPGVGLGLSIARQAAEYLGAKLWAESVPKQGSAFHVLLPSELPMKS
jgi:signal transduction histidine kinase